MNTQTALDLISARQTTIATAADELRAQITALTGELARLEGQLTDLDTIRPTLLSLSAEQAATADPTIVSEPYQQTLAVFRNATGPLRAKDVCLARQGAGTRAAALTPRTPPPHTAGHSPHAGGRGCPYTVASTGPGSPTNPTCP